MIHLNVHLKKWGNYLKMRIRLFTEEFIEAFGRDIDDEYEKLYRTGDKQALLEIFEKAPTYEADIPFDFHELTTPNDYTNNTKIIYGSLRELTPAQASKETLWFTLANTVYLDYTLKLLSSNDRTKVKNALFLKTKREQLVQCISKYWWLGYLLYDEKSDDPYELLNYFCKQDAIGKAISFFSSNLTGSKNVTLGIVAGIRQRDKYLKNVKLTYAFINGHFNAVGGVKILDMMTQEEVYQETLAFIDEIVADPSMIPPTQRNKILRR